VKNNQIRYYSTNLRSPEVTFREALLKGLAPDGGLYMPRTIPLLSEVEMESFSHLNYHQIAFKVLNSFLSSEIESEHLKELCLDAYNYEVPIEKVYDRNYVMRLDQGPTASFKDFAVRMMGRLMQHFLSLENRHLTILTATSGDTGSAVANAFYGLDNIKVIILYPDGEVTEVQRKQMTTLKKNITVFAVNGKFDDCQRLVKTAFSDPLLSHIPLSSANSINIGRLLPQAVYYFYAWAKLSGKTDNPVIFSVPSGNFGNLMGGLIAREMGLPVKKFIIATNENDEVPEFLQTGNYKAISPSMNCISSAMNVGHPSNFARIVALYGGTIDEKGNILKAPAIDQMRSDFMGVRVTDNETRETITGSYKQYGLMLEPHGAVAWRGLQKYLGEVHEEKNICIALETAHPSKFGEEMVKILGIDPVPHYSLKKLGSLEEEFIKIVNEYPELHNYIMGNNQ
jgi:threonine synthase